MYVLDGQKLNLNEFIGSFRNDLYRRRVKDAFDFSVDAVSVLKFNFHTPRKPFVLEVERRDVKNAQAIAMDSEPADKIIMSDALVKHCIGAAPIPLDDVFRVDPITEFDYELPAQCALAWALAHEATHLYRSHDQVERMHKKRIDPSMLGQALEMDADMLGVSCVYRLMQMRFSFRYSDDYVRKLTLYSIYWAMRTLHSDGGLRTHLTIGPRIEQVLAKISSVGADPFMPPFLQEQDEVVRRSKMLAKCLNRFEESLQRRGGDGVDVAAECEIHRKSGRREALLTLSKNISKDIGRLSNSPAGLWKGL